jgi:biotin carboxylase
MEVPAFASLAGGADRLSCVAAATEVGLPAVLKRQSGTGSRGTSLVTTVDELVTAVAEAEGGPYILEAYLLDRVAPERQRIADYVSVENIVTHGVVSAVAVTGRTPLAEGFRETGSFIPSTLGPDEQAAVITASRQAAHALGVTTGCLHTEIKLTPHGPRIIEVNGRVAGGGIPDVLRLVNGFCLVQAAGRAALGESIKLDHLVPTNGIGYQLALQPARTESEVRRVVGIDQLRALPSVVGVTTYAREGQPVERSVGSYGYLLTMLGHAETHQEVLAAFQAMTTQTRVEYG